MMRRAALLLMTAWVGGLLGQAAVAAPQPPSSAMLEAQAAGTVPGGAECGASALAPGERADGLLDFLVPAPQPKSGCYFSSCGQAWDLCRLSCDGCPWEIAHCNTAACAYDCICHWELC